MKKLLDKDLKLRIYIFVITLLAIILGIFFSKEQEILLSDLIFWAIIGTVAESLIIALTNGAGVSVGFAVSVAAIIVIGPINAAISGAFGVAFRITDVGGKGKKQHIFNTQLHKTIFNSSEVFISTLLAGYFYELIGGKIGSVSWPQAISLIPIYFILNTFFIWILVSIILNKKQYDEWASTLKNVIINCTLVGLIGVIMALVAIKIDIYAVLLFFGPLLIARYSYKQYTDMRDTYLETINAFNKALEAKDSYTSGHSQRVQEYSEKLAEALGLSSKKVRNIKTAAILHDIGKIGIDDFILRKPDKLTKEEYDIIKEHPAIGADILKDVDFLRNAALIIRSHHERYDGKGYPDGKKGNEIPIESSILSIADVFDAMTSNRPYRDALSREEALSEIKNNAGIQFNPEVANKFCEMMNEE